MLLSKISQLPIELVNIIYLYIPLSTKGVLTSKMFVEYYNEKMKTMIFSEFSIFNPRARIENYAEVLRKYASPQNSFFQ